MTCRIVAALLVAACSGSPAHLKVPGDRFHVGELEVMVLEDGHLVVPNDAKLLGVGRTPAEIGDVLAAAGLRRDEIRLDIQCLLVKARDRMILFDAGAGAFIPTAGHLAASLAHAGIPPGAITDVFISHAHSDHIGGLVADGALAFPEATIRMSAPEWAELQQDTDAASQRFIALIAPKVTTFEPGAQVLPLVKAVATHGHTVGHSSYEIAGELFYLGDVAHHAVLSVQQPSWRIAVDADATAAEAVRRQTLAKLAADRTLVFAGHFPFPGVGRIGAGMSWKPGL